ncbi:MAG: NAD(P)-binding protein, partial [Myxococcales bacterium]|nr:NAD(P)-binding protein [Myxococcales bacterium]
MAIIGGGAAGLTTALELTRPELRGQYEVTVYQLGWRLGGKGASGRGVADRIEEHGLHLWLGFYDNAFAMMREVYEELGRDPRSCHIATWRDAFVPDPAVGLADLTPDGRWLPWIAHFPASPGEPGDAPPGGRFSVQTYVVRGVARVAHLFHQRFA